MHPRKESARDLVFSLVVLALCAMYILYYRGVPDPATWQAVGAYAAWAAGAVCAYTTLESLVGLF